MIHKKGMIPEYLVTVILLIVGFVLVILVITQFSWNETIDREICHESVIVRATLPNTGNLQSLSPLKCSTAKYCVQGSKLFSSSKCEESYGEVDGVIKTKVSKKEQIERLIVQEIASCWNMMGQGKVSLFSQYWAQEYGFGEVYPTCVICSRIAFDKESLLEAGITIEDLQNINPLNYSMTHKMPNQEISYYEYLGGKMADIGDVGTVTELGDIMDSAKTDLEKQIKKLNSQDGEDVDEKKLELLEELEFIDEEIGRETEVQEVAILFMQVSAPEQFDTLFNIGKQMIGINAGTAYVLGWKKGISYIAKSAKYQLIFGAIIGTYSQLQTLYNRNMVAGYCGDIAFGDDARSGCSVVRTVPYDAIQLRKYCSVVEGTG